MTKTCGACSCPTRTGFIERLDGEERPNGQLHFQEEDLAALMPARLLSEALRTLNPLESNRPIYRYFCITERVAHLLVRAGMPIIRVQLSTTPGGPVYRYSIKTRHVRPVQTAIDQIARIGIGRMEAMWRARDRAGNRPA